MCSLFASTMPVDALARLFNLSGPLTNLPAVPEVWPGHEAPVLVPDSGALGLRIMNWGFIYQPEGKAARPVGNARDDRLTSPFWRHSFETRRCLVPVTRFAEPDPLEKWQRKQWFGVRGQEFFLLAGIWREWRGRRKGEMVTLTTMSFVTTQANDLVKPIHPNRMPVILPFDVARQWTDGPAEQAQALLRPFDPDQMIHEPEATVQPGLF